MWFKILSDNILKVNWWTPHKDFKCVEIIIFDTSDIIVKHMWFVVIQFGHNCNQYIIKIASKVGDHKRLNTKK